MILIPETSLQLKRGGYYQCASFPISDLARSLKVSTARQCWPVKREDRYGPHVIAVHLEISEDGGPFVPKYSYIVEGGERDIQRHPFAYGSYGLEPGYRRRGRVRIEALRGLTTKLLVENSITVGTPNSAYAFSAGQTLSVDAGSGVDRCLFAWATREGQQLTSLKYNSLDMTFIVGDTTANTEHSVLYRALSPAAGAHNLVSVLTGSQNNTLMGVPLAGVNQTTPHGTGIEATGTGSPITVNITDSVPGDIVIDGFDLVHTAGGGTTTVSGGQSPIIDLEAYGGGTGSGGVSQKAGASGTVTMSWTATVAGAWSTSAVAVKPSAVLSKRSQFLTMFPV